MTTELDFRLTAITAIAETLGNRGRAQSVEDAAAAVFDTLTPLIDQRAAAAEHIMAQVDAVLRQAHQIEMFGDCVEDGQKFPCRTIKVLDIAARHRGVGEAPGPDVELAEGLTVTVGDRTGKLVLEAESEGPEAPPSWFVEFQPDGNVERILTDEIVAVTPAA